MVSTKRWAPYEVNIKDHVVMFFLQLVGQFAWEAAKAFNQHLLAGMGPPVCLRFVWLARPHERAWGTQQERGTTARCHIA